MTEPTGNSGGFTDDDSITTTIGINLPAGALDDIREINRLQDELKTHLEMQSRFTQDIFDYTNKLPDIQKTTLDLKRQEVDLIRTQLELEERISNTIATRRGGSASSGQDNGGGIDYNHPARPPIGSAPPSPGADPANPPSGRPPSPAPGGGSSGSGSPSGRPSGGSGRPLGNTNEVLNQVDQATRVSGAGSGLSSAGGIANALGAAIRDNPGISNTGFVGQLGASALKVAPWAMAAGAAVGTVNKIAETYAGIDQQGESAHGGGFGEGLGYEMAVRSMALSPWISTEQARKIVMSGINSGMTGKELDTVTEYMAQNMKKMGTDVETSMKFVNAAVVQGNVSIEALAKNMTTLDNLAGSGPMTQTQITGNAADVLTDLVSSGVDSQQATSVMAEAAVFGNVENSPLFKSNLGVKLTQALSNPNFAMYVASVAGIHVRDPSQVKASLIAAGLKPHEAAYNAMRTWNETNNSNGTQSDRMQRFIYQFSKMTGFDDQLLRNIFTSLSGDVDLVDSSQDQVNEATGDNKVVSDTRYAGGYATGESSSVEDDQWFTNKAMSSVVTSSRKLGVYDPSSGKTWKVNYQNKDMMDRIASGEFKLAELPNEMSEYNMHKDYKSDSKGWEEVDSDALGGVDPSKTGVKLDDAVALGGLPTGASSGSYQIDSNVKIDLSPEAAKWLRATQENTPAAVNKANTMSGDAPAEGSGVDHADPSNSGGYVGSWGG